MTTLNNVSKSVSSGKPSLWLLGDVGGTHCRLASVSVGGSMTNLRTYDNDCYTDFASLAREYLSECAESRPTRAVFAVAGPVQDGRVRLTNRGWLFDTHALKADLQCTEVRLMNDFTAIAWSLLRLDALDLLALGGGSTGKGPRGVLGPGTGLGVSGLIPAASGWSALLGEGGHATLAAHSREQDAVLENLRQRFGHVSAERVLSGPGFAVLYRALAEIRGVVPRDLSPEQVTACAATDPVAAAALQMYFGFLGSFSGNLALTLGASGGIYLAGGVLPQLQAALVASDFRSRFAAKGRFHSYLEAIPTFLIRHPQPGLLGLCAYLSEAA